jgi:tRNA(fMet)-specific endonuclease VapC
MLKYPLDTNIVVDVIKRRPIGVNDLHIAARARSEGLTLVTNNLGEFERVPGLLTENWAAGLA